MTLLAESDFVTGVRQEGQAVRGQTGRAFESEK
jgi:hypothetical protein